MTCIVACVGLLPAALSTGIGSQVQRPLALVVVGGMLLAPVLILLVLPVLILKFSTARELPAEIAAGWRELNAQSAVRAACRCMRQSRRAVGGGCACVGPEFSSPGRPSVERYTDEPLAADHRGGAGRRRSRAALPRASRTCRRNWWTLFGSAELDELVTQALRANPERRVGAGGAAPGHGESPRRSAASYFPAGAGGASTRSVSAMPSACWRPR